MPRSFRGMECPNWPPEGTGQSDSITKTYEIQVITPIFGGGVKAGVNDPVTLIRPSSIRGHLRFWWRATRGAKFATVADLRQREGEIWGTTKSPSQVTVEAAILSSGTTYPCAYLVDGKIRFKDRHPAYALFPFQGNKKEGRQIAECTSKASFELRLTYPQSLSQDVDAAVWAWTNFGGIGARTRRGCGALYCEELSPEDTSSIKSWYKNQLEGFGISLQPQEWPTLPESLLVRSSSGAMQAWTEVIDLMQTFRQGQNVGRDPGKTSNRPKRSRWPEPESVRNIVFKQKGLKIRPDKWHPPDQRMLDVAFPRAEFGMPIIIEIRGEGLKPTLQRSEDHDRMASPLILRPIRFSDGSFASMIVRLDTPPLKSAYLKPGKSDLKFGYRISTSEIADPRLSAYPDSPMNFCTSGSALDAFVSFAISLGFKEGFP